MMYMSETIRTVLHPLSNYNDKVMSCVIRSCLCVFAQLSRVKLLNSSLFPSESYDPIIDWSSMGQNTQLKCILHH